MGQICGKVKSSSTESDGESSDKKSLTHAIQEKNSQVFENALLREKILGYVITNATATWKDICSLRLVQKVWLRDVTKILHDSRRPFFQLNLTEISFPNRKGYIRYKMKLLDRFVSIMETSSTDPPPLHLKIQKDFFRDENHQSFSDFLKSGYCASSLASLEIIAPRNGGSMTFLFPSPISFPNLKKVTLSFSGGNLNPDQNTSSAVTNNGSNSNFIPFIQSILNGTKTLDAVDLNGAPNLVPHGIKYLVFPNNLAELHLNCALDSNQLQVLVRNSLPHLTRLALVTTNTPLTADILSRILDNVKGTLRELYISSEGRIYQITRNTNSLLFPVMKCLEACMVDATFLELELETQLLPLSAYLPNLKRMELIFQTVACFRKWTDSVCFLTVTHVSFTFANLRKFTLKEMQVIQKAFPILQSFTLEVDFVEMEALQYLFQEMRQLTELRIRLGEVTGQEMSYHWDSLLIGIPDQFARSHLENNPRLSSQNFNLSSIKNLTALRKLELSTATASRHFAFKQYLISDLAFHHAILQMPTLKFVELAGAFMPSPSMKSHLNLLNTHKDSDSDAVYICHF